MKSLASDLMWDVAAAAVGANDPAIAVAVCAAVTAVAVAAKLIVFVQHVDMVPARTQNSNA